MVAEPFHPASDRLVNLRDLGGLLLDSGGRTRHEVLLRSAAPLPGDTAPTSTTWPPKSVVDLRNSSELGGRDHPLATPGTAVYACPFLAGPARAPGTAEWSGRTDLASAYVRFLREGSAKLAAVTELLARCDAPVLIHCTAGKDRTGIVVAVLMRAVGVSRAAVIEDYRATEAALPAIIARIPPELTARLDPTVAQRLMGVPERAITAVLDEIDDAPGGAQGWLRAAGAGAYALDAWRHRFINTLHLCD
jgi:hypothetical protein